MTLTRRRTCLSTRGWCSGRTGVIVSGLFGLADRSPPVCLLRAELPCRAVDRGVLAADLIDRPRARSGIVQATLMQKL
jgi:hypothetical protein